MASWNSATPAAGPASVPGAERGIVRRGASEGVFDLRRLPVGPALEPFAEHVWCVSWDRRGAPPHESRTIPFPSVHLTVEHGEPGEVRHGHPVPATLLHGVVTRAFRVRLSGSGWVVGVKFHPGGWAAWSGGDAGALTDRVVPAPARWAAAGADVLAAGTVEERAALLVAALGEVAPEPSQEYLDVLALVARMRDDAGLVRAGQVADLAGCTPRTLQRRFLRLVGVGPKWVLNRFRLQEAALLLERDPDADLAGVAAKLGWYDQAHFSNDFRRILGERPGRYAAAARRSAG
ncbi:helix-turn-helix domain-containing protein [Kineococcus glutinatus]|uniref:Helix-turn-helix domain-containing protein n=1 Tax=Kineococcus glutinatus TaxID=1070872 RepID=A0ABP9HEP4_9ACTN